MSLEGRTAKILIVAAEQSNLELLETILHLAGYSNLFTTTDLEYAIALFKENNPDLVLLDLHMPPRNEDEMLCALRSLSPANAFLPIVLLAADATEDMRRRLLAEGATDFVSKPADAVEVMLRVENLLRVRFLEEELQNEKAPLERRLKERTRVLEQTIAELRCAEWPLFRGNR